MKMVQHSDHNDSKGLRGDNNTHTIHVWYVYLHEWFIFGIKKRKYTIHRPMDLSWMGYVMINY